MECGVFSSKVEASSQIFSVSLGERLKVLVVSSATLGPLFFVRALCVVTPKMPPHSALFAQEKDIDQVLKSKADPNL